jgi:hypothetical protein
VATVQTTEKRSISFSEWTPVNRSWSTVFSRLAGKKQHRPCFSIFADARWHMLCFLCSHKLWSPLASAVHSLLARGRLRPSLRLSLDLGVLCPSLPLGGKWRPSVGKVGECDVESRHHQGCSPYLCRLRTDGLAPTSKY